jgi:hypothetical protein
MEPLSKKRRKVCYLCQEIGHSTSKCPQIALIVCVSCGLRGHIRTKCPQTNLLQPPNSIVGAKETSKCDESAVKTEPNPTSELVSSDLERDQEMKTDYESTETALTYPGIISQLGTKTETMKSIKPATCEKRSGNKAIETSESEHPVKVESSVTASEDIVMPNNCQRNVSNSTSNACDTVTTKCVVTSNSSTDSFHTKILTSEPERDQESQAIDAKDKSDELMTQGLVISRSTDVDTTTETQVSVGGQDNVKFEPNENSDELTAKRSITPESSHVNSLPKTKISAPDYISVASVTKANSDVLVAESLKTPESPNDENLAGTLISEPECDQESPTKGSKKNSESLKTQVTVTHESSNGNHLEKTQINVPECAPNAKALNVLDRYSSNDTSKAAQENKEGPYQEVSNYPSKDLKVTKEADRSDMSKKDLEKSNKELSQDATTASSSKNSEEPIICTSSSDCIKAGTSKKSQQAPENAGSSAKLSKTAPHFGNSYLMDKTYNLKNAKSMNLKGFKGQFVMLEAFIDIPKEVCQNNDFALVKTFASKGNKVALVSSHCRVHFAKPGSAKIFVTIKKGLNNLPEGLLLGQAKQIGNPNVDFEENVANSKSPLKMVTFSKPLKIGKNQVSPPLHVKLAKLGTLRDFDPCIFVPNHPKARPKWISYKVASQNSGFLTSISNGDIQAIEFKTSQIGMLYSVYGIWRDPALKNIKKAIENFPDLVIQTEPAAYKKHPLKVLM